MFYIKILSTNSNDKGIYYQWKNQVSILSFRCIILNVHEYFSLFSYNVFAYYALNFLNDANTHHCRCTHVLNLDSNHNAIYSLNCAFKYCTGF